MTYIVTYTVKVEAEDSNEALEKANTIMQFDQLYKLAVGVEAVDEA
jgi:hypothetical protein